MRTEDGYIVSQCLNGDSAAFGLLVEKYKAGVYALAYSRLHNFQDAEDIAQEVFIKAYQKLRDLKRWDRFVSWLYIITSNLCRDFLRTKARRLDTDYVEDQNPEILEARSVRNHREELMYEMVNDALDSLPEIYRDVLVLYYIGDMSGKEIAAFLGISPTTVRQRLARGRIQLKEGIIAMMSTTYEQKKLQASFTFHIVETVKRIRQMPRITGLPWGLSAAAGIILAITGLNPNLNVLDPSDFHKVSPLTAEMKVLKTEEIPVDVLKISQNLAIASKRGNGGGELRLADERGDPLLAPQASEVKLKPENGAAGDGFGYSVAIHGKYAIVGACYKDDKKGVAYILKRDGNSWKEQEMLFARDGAKEDYFGIAVAISDDYAIVGACDDDDKGEDTGSVYVFHRTGESWTQQVKLTPRGQLIKWCEFGLSVAISGDYLVVGSRFDDHAGGAIYIFKRDGDAWVEQAKLKSSNWAWYDRFGEAVSISGDYVIASAPYHDNKTGSAYIFKRDGDKWKEQAILTADDGKEMDFFSYSVSISGDYAIAGARGAGGDWRGASYIFVREGVSWRQQAKIVPDDLAMNDQFGYSVSISEGRAIVGSIYTGGNKGAVYGFTREGNSWKQVSKLTASDGNTGDCFGKVDFSGNYAIVGASGADVSGADSGAAYIYHCAEDLLFPALPVENSGFYATTLGSEKNKPMVPGMDIPPPVVPEKPRLLQNFPNPFNPETWLPYELSFDTPVIIHIYNITGEPVRRLNQGRQNTGSYTTKDKAAYWDGRDEAGEQVASGLYFYSIQAGNFTATKKMIVKR